MLKNKRKTFHKLNIFTNITIYSQFKHVANNSFKEITLNHLQSTNYLVFVINFIVF
jgi:hypothetical protein